MIRFNPNKQLKSDDIQFRLYSLMSYPSRQQIINFSIESFFAQAYWRVISADPNGKAVPFVGAHILELVTDPRLYVTAPLPENQTGQLLITQLYGGSIGNFLPFKGKKEFTYVRLKPHTASTGLFQFDQLTNEYNEKFLQIDISAAFNGHLEVAVVPPEPNLFGVSHILRPISGKSIVFTYPYWPNGGGSFDPLNPPNKAEEKSSV